MTDPTPLDLAHAAIGAAPDDPTPRLRYYGRLAATELFLLLDREVETDDRIAPRVFDLDEGPVVLAFDSEVRLTRFTGVPAPYAALPGRMLAGMLAGQGLGLGVNLDTAAAELLPPPAVAWWAGMLADAPEPVDLRPETLTAPGPLPEALLAALDARLAAAAGLAGGAWLAGTRFEDGRTGLLLAFLDATPGAEPALARAASDALRFSGAEALTLDVTFLGAAGPVADRLSRVGLRIDLPDPEPDTRLPLSDPDAPPRLR